MKKTINLILLLVIILSSFTGCFLNTSRETEKDIFKNIISNAQYVKNECVKGSKDDPFIEKNIYYYENNDFSFTFTKSIERDKLFGFKVTAYYTDYFKELFKFKKNEIEEIINKNGFEYKEESIWKLEQQEPIERSLCIIETSYIYDFNVDISFLFLNFNDIEKSYIILKEIDNLLKPYYPEQSEYFNFEFDLYTFSTTANLLCNRNKLYYGHKNITTKSLVENNDEYIIWSEYLYVKNTNKPIDTTKNLSLYENNPESIDKIYINGELFKSQKYETKFQYHPIENKYYTPAGFGIELAYNGGVKDHLQREIIEKYYPNSNYSINGNTTEYKIGNNHFKITRSEVKNSTYDNFKYTINNKVVDIKSPSYLTSGASYFTLISLEDFALLTGLEIEKVDTNKGCIYFKTKY